MATLPDNATFEDAEDVLDILSKLDRAMKSIQAGKGIPDEEVRRQMAHWLK